MPRVTASVVIYNPMPDDIKRLLESVMSSPIETLYVIDHYRNSNSQGFFPKDNKIIYIKEKNRGYGAGNNTAISRALLAGVDYHLVLNPDVYWEEEVVEELVGFMESDSSIGLIMPKILYPDGTFQYQAKLLPSPGQLIFKRFLKGCRSLKTIKEYELRDSGFDRIMNVPFLSGCFMLFRAETLREIGGFDERFFMYAEDIDITRRIHRSHQTIYYPFVSIKHRLARESTRDLRLFIIHVVNTIRYFNKWGWYNDKERKKINSEVLSRYVRAKQNGR